MNRDYVRRATKRDADTYLVIDLEWHMLQMMCQEDGRQLTEEDFRAFYQVRYSQHCAINADTMTMYYSDLMAASQTGRNLMKEKYAYMRAAGAAGTAGAAGAAVGLDPACASLVRAILPEIIKSYQAFAAKYKALSTMTDAFDSLGETVPVEVYITSELITKSEVTLKMIQRDVRLNPNYVEDLYRTFISFFDMDSLEKADVLIASQAQRACRGATLY